MIREITIKNIAIIDALCIQFDEGLNVLTGETGAGKSVIINALNVILGGKNVASRIRSGCDQGQVEVVFQLPTGSSLVAALDEAGIDCEDATAIFKRIVNQNGRSRCWVNGSAVTVKKMTELAHALIDISSQRESQYLLHRDNHIKVLDNDATIAKVLVAYQDVYHVWRSTKTRYDKALLDCAEAHRQRDYLTYQQREIEEASIQEGELEALAMQRQRLLHAHTLFQVLSEGENQLYNDDQSAFSQVSRAYESLQPYVDLDPQLKTLAEQLSQTIIGVEESVGDFRKNLKSITTDPEALTAVEDRFEVVADLIKKYGGNEDALFAYAANLVDTIHQIDHLEEELKALKLKLSDIEGRLMALAHKLSQKRQRRAGILAKKIEHELSDLGMASARFEIRVEVPKNIRHQIEGQAVSLLGIDEVEFFIATNAGEKFYPLTEIVSGGEMSRIMLSIKSILARTEDVQVFVFDEIDTGIGGEIAKIVGKKLASLSNSHQILCITHLAQVASFATQHFLVSKHENQSRTTTAIERLDEQLQQPREIARMISGQAISDQSLALAEEMISHSRNYRQSLASSKPS